METNPVLDEVRKKIIAARRDTRFSIDAYAFILNGLEFIQTRLGEKRHVTGQELARGLAEFACKQYGPLAWTVLSGWGIGTTADFGTMVYNLIDIGVLGKTGEDRLDDFFDVMDLDAFFKSQDPYVIDKEFIRTIAHA